MKFLFTIIALVFLLTGCDEPLSSDTVQRKAQEALSAQSNSAVGMPAIVNFQEKRVLKDILELRDKAVVTTTYIMDMNAGLHKLCDSIGYGMPAATQYTNPQRIINAYGNSYVTLPQADPNGLFSPASAEGTYVMCKNPHGTDIGTVYSEPRIIVSPFPLEVK